MYLQDKLNTSIRTDPVYLQEKLDFHFRTYYLQKKLNSLFEQIGGYLQEKFKTVQARSGVSPGTAWLSFQDRSSQEKLNCLFRADWV